MIAKRFGLLLGVVLLVVGLAGIFTGGHDHDLMVFGVNTSHNVVHLLSGAIAIACGLVGERAARMFCIAFGVVYGLVAVGGFAGIASVVRLLNLNRADDFLHLAIALACIVAALLSARRSGIAVPMSSPTK